MRGVMFKGNREAEIREFPDPHAGPGEAVLKVRASGLCGTDLHRYRGTKPIDAITGHEPCGVIAELGVGAAPGLAIGDRVICHHYAGCGVCENCTMGYEQLCLHGHVTFGGVNGNGANADYILVTDHIVSRHVALSNTEDGGQWCWTCAPEQGRKCRVGVTTGLNP